MIVAMYKMGASTPKGCHGFLGKSFHPYGIELCVGE